MAEQTTSQSETVFAFNPDDFRLKLGQIRKNHALEHATLKLIQPAKRRGPVGGYSNVGGFWLIGDIDFEEVERAAAQALTRLKGGAKNLAVHTRCGTNYAVTGLLGSFGVLLSLIGIKNEGERVIDRLPLFFFFITLANLFGPSLGMKVQEHVTTDADPGEVAIIGIEKTECNGIILHRIHTHTEGIEGGLCRLIWTR